MINNTRNVTNINVTNNYYGGAAGNFRNVSTGGPSLADVNAHAHTHVQTVHLANANQAGRSTLQGNSLAVYAPHMNGASAHTARPAQVRPESRASDLQPGHLDLQSAGGKCRLETGRALCGSHLGRP